MLTYLLRYLESCAKSTIRRVLYSLYMINLGGVMVRCPLQVALACYLENRKTFYSEQCIFGTFSVLSILFCSECAERILSSNFAYLYIGSFGKGMVPTVLIWQIKFQCRGSDLHHFRGSGSVSIFPNVIFFLSYFISTAKVSKNTEIQIHNPHAFKSIVILWRRWKPKIIPVTQCKMKYVLRDFVFPFVYYPVYQGWAKLVLIALERYSVELKRLTFNFR